MTKSGDWIRQLLYDLFFIWEPGWAHGQRGWEPGNVVQGLGDGTRCWLEREPEDGSGRWSRYYDGSNYAARADFWWQGPGVGRRTQLGTALVEAGSCCIAEWKCGQLRGKGTTRAISAQWVRRNQGKWSSSPPAVWPSSESCLHGPTPRLREKDFIQDAQPYTKNRNVRPMPMLPGVAARF